MSELNTRKGCQLTDENCITFFLFFKHSVHSINYFDFDFRLNFDLTLTIASLFTYYALDL